MRQLFVGLFLSMLLIATSCDFLNKKPEQTTEPKTINQMLADAQERLATDLMGFNVGITTALWLQQVKGFDGSAKEHYNYVYSTAETDQLWRDFYFILRDLDSIGRWARDTQARYYEAVAKIMQAVTLGNLTDLFGDVPYSQAFQLDSPAFDPQQYIYEQIFNLLDQAIEIIDQGDPGVANLPADVDRIYNWDMSLWRKAAFTLKARYLLHLSNVSHVDYNQILQWLDNGLSSLDDDMRFYFYKIDKPSPILKYIADNDGLGNNPFYQGIIADYADPRVSVLSYNGFWVRPDAYFPFIQYTEALFIRAEAYWRLGDSLSAKSSLKSAVRASFDKYIVVDDQWLENYYDYVDSLSNDTLIYEIWRQKYLDLLYHPEAYNDWRRVDYPQLEPVVGDSIPLRLPYSNQEMSRNPNAPQWGTDVTLFTPVWWDSSSGE